MTNPFRADIFSGMRKQILLVAFLALTALIIAGFGARSSSAPFSSAEVQFTDASAHGLQIVPASCPSSPHYTGECSSACPTGYSGTPPNCTIIPTPPSGGGGGVCPIGYTLSSSLPSLGDKAGGQCVFSGCPLGYTLSGSQCVFTVCPAGYTLVAGQCARTTCPTGYTLQGENCIPPASINFVSFSATNPNGNFTASGHLQVVPILVRSGNTVQVYWNVANAAGCSVTSNAGDAWNTNSSGAAGQTSRPVTVQTTFTLNCTALAGATPPSVHESQVVNIIPVFNEL